MIFMDREEHALKLLLQERLSKLKWSNKLALYNSVIDSVVIKDTTINNIENTVIVVAHKYSRDLVSNLELLNQEKDEDTEIIFVNNNIPENELFEIDKYINVRVNINNNSGACVARNIGAVFSNGSLLIFVDDDGKPDENFLKGHILSHKMFNIISARGVCLPKTNKIFMDHYCLGTEISSSYCNLEGNYSIIADVFFEVGGWNDNLFYGHEGMELSYRLIKYDSDISKQIYSPLPILYHDYVKNESDKILKYEKLETSRKEIVKFSPMFETVMNLWMSNTNKTNEIDYRICLSNSIYYDFQSILDCARLKIDDWKQSTENSIFDFRDINIDLMIKRKNFFENKKIYIFGSGKKGKKVFNSMKNLNIEIVGFVDNNEDIHGKYICNKKINLLNEICNDAFVLVASMWENEINLQLMDKGFSNHIGFANIII